MRAAKIVIPLLIALGVLLYIYARTSPPPVTIPSDAATNVPAQASPISSPSDNNSANSEPSVSSTDTPNVQVETNQPITGTNALTITEPLSITASTSGVTPTWEYEVLQTFPHDPAAFTQGLIWLDNIFYEGTGLRGRSTLRQVDRDSGKVLKEIQLPEEYFGEGITVFGDKLYQLTWQSNIGFIYNKNSFDKIAEFSYPTEGWGITHDGERLIMSDGSATLYIWDPETLAEIGQIEVTDQGQPVVRLNELEYINGSIYANIWQTDKIAVIDPATGKVTAWLDLTGILSPADRSGGEDVLNGIAYNAESDTLYITGKLWPKLFEIRLLTPQ